MSIAFVPLRGGSKSIPLKNIKEFCGKPLCYWVIQALQSSNKIDKIVCATDSNDIANTITSFNFDKVEIYRRSEENAQDTSSTEAVMLEYLRNIITNDTFILVQATNPFTTTQDINRAFGMFLFYNYNIISCVRFKRFFWRANGVPKNYDIFNRPRRQEFEGELMENGAFYISTVDAIKKHKCRISGNIGIYEMPEYTAYEIDEPDDWVVMEHLFKKYMLCETKDTPIQQAVNVYLKNNLCLSLVNEEKQLEGLKKHYEIINNVITRWDFKGLKCPTKEMLY